MRSFRVLHVTPYSADAWAYGGIPRLADALTRGLARLGHDVTVCTTDACDRSSRLGTQARHPRSREWPAARTADGVTLRVFPNLSNRCAYHWQLFLPIGLNEYLQRSAASFDVAHLHACRNVPGAMAAHHLRRAGVPYVLAPNGTAPRIERRRFAKRVFDLAIGARIVSGASRVIAVSEAERVQLGALGVEPGAIRVVPNPIDLDEFNPPPARGRFRHRIGVGASEPVVLFLGRLSPRKRVDVLVRAFARLVGLVLPPSLKLRRTAVARSAEAGRQAQDERESSLVVSLSNHELGVVKRPSDPPTAGRHVRLVIAGNDMGSADDTRRLVAALGIQDRVLFTGLLRGRDRLEALADADVLVYPSQDEIFGLVPLEALLCGTPVIVADDSGCAEVVRSVGGGQIVPLADVEALTHAIDTVIGTPHHWRAEAAQPAVRVRAAYARDVVCAGIETVYRELVKAG